MNSEINQEFESLEKFLNIIPLFDKGYTPIKKTKIVVPEALSSFVEPPVYKIEGDGCSPFIIITAPGATGKSTVSNYIAKEKNMYYWNLAGADIGDNYFIGHLNETFGASNISRIISDIQSGKIGFIIDAFDEAEESCGWPRIQNFIKEIDSFTHGLSKPSIILVARPETANYIALYLADLFKTQKYNYYKIGFFSKEKAKEFLIKLLGNKLGNNIPHKDRILQIFEHIANGVDKVLSQDNTEGKFQFYGYAPVIQAITELFKDTTNFQLLEREYANNTDFSRKLITQIMNDILIREQDKFMTNFHPGIAARDNGCSDIKEIYSPCDQIYYLISKCTGGDLDFLSKISSLDLPQDVIRYYPDAAARFLENHPFLDGNKDFVSTVFRDYCCAILMAKKDYSSLALFLLSKSMATITPLLGEFYLNNQNDGEKFIDGTHIGIILESLQMLTQAMNGDTRSAIYQKKDKYILSYSKSQDTDRREISTEIRINGEKLIFYNHLRNISIDSSCDIELYSDGGTFLLDRTDIHTDGNIEFKASKLEVIGNDDYMDEVNLISSNNCLYQSSMKIELIGRFKSFKINFPNGKQYPFADYFMESDSFEVGNYDNALRALWKVLSWLRKDKRDSIARHIDLINNVVRSSNINKAMLQYLIDNHVLFQTGVFYKLALKESARKGINFTDLRNATPNSETENFIKGFIKLYSAQ